VNNLSEVIKLKLFLKAMLVFVIGISTVSLSAMEREPAGKNLINLAYFSTSVDEIYTHTPFVLEGGTYMFQYNYNSVHDVEIRLDGQTIIEGSNPAQGCETHTTYSFNTCEFESHENAEIEIFLGGHQLDRYFGMSDVFILSKGSEIIPYEPFIAKETESEVEISGEATYYVSYDQVMNPESLIGSHITAYDEIEGDLTDQIVVTSDAYSSNATELGSYEVIYEVEDSALNKALFELTMKVVDQIPPVIEGPEHLTYTHDQNKSLDAIIQSNFTMVDDYDGEITDFNILSDPYSANNQMVGSYEVSFEIEDSSNNQTTHTFTIEIIDDQAPLIEGSNIITMALSDPYTTVNEILENYEISDDYTSEADLIFEIYDKDALDLTVKGEYEMTLKLEDCSGNETFKTIELHIIDDILPVLELPTQYKSISYSEPFDLDAFIATIVLSDNSSELDHDDIYIELNEYENRKPDELGSYLIIFKVDDLSNNTGEARLIIETFDDIAPVFVVENEIMMQSGLTLNDSQLFEHLLLDETIHAFNPTSMVVLENNHLGNESSEGSYELTVELSNKAGETMPVSTLITVNEIKEEASSFSLYWWGLSIVPIGLIGGYIIKKRK